MALLNKTLVSTIRRILINNLNSSQFDSAENIEEQQRRRFKRKRESGFVGNGYWFSNYPFMMGTMGTGGFYQTDGDHNEPNDRDEHSEDAGSMAGETAAGTTGMGDGGTASSTGPAGGGMP